MTSGSGVSSTGGPPAPGHHRGGAPAVPDAPAPGPTRLRLGVLGPLTVELDGRPVVLPSLRQRALLVLLASDLGRVVSVDRLVDRLWDGAPPPQAVVTLRSYVSNLRHALGGREGAAAALVTRGPGYALELPPEALDAVRLRRLADQGHEHLRAGRPAQASAAFEEAVGLWRGEPLAEVADHEAVQSTVTTLTELYLGAQEGRFEALIATGRHRDALPDLEAFTTEHPLREGPRALQMLALYRSGRAPEALEVHRRFRRLLHDELGLDPSARLQALLSDILGQAPDLAAPVPDGGAARPAASGTARAARTPPAPDDAHPPRAGGRPRRVVGRDRETAVLLGRVERLRRDRTGGVVLLAGEPGIGKTTLLELLEDEARQRGLGVHVGRCPGADGAPSLWPWTQVVGSVAAGLDEGALAAACATQAHPVVQLSPALADRFGPPPALADEDAGSRRFLLHEAVSVFLRRACPDPALVLLDDLHAADPPSLELLSHLAPTLAGRPLLVVATLRDLPADRTPALETALATLARLDDVDELVLGGLEPSHVAELLAPPAGTAPDQPLDEALVALLHQRTGGNPFFARQLGRLLLEDGPDRQHLATAVPPGVRHVISARLATLSAPTRRLLEAAAVLGREFDVVAAAAVAGTGVEEAWDACDEAGRHGLVEVAGSGHRFVHALVHEAVVTSVPAGRAVRLHAAAAEHLGRTGGPVDQRAEHGWQARDLVGARAVPAQLAAAERAMSVFAFERADQYLRRALDLVRRSSPADPHTELSILLSLFQLIATSRGWGADDAREVVARARELAAAGAMHPDSVRLWWSLWLYLLDRDDATAGAEVAGLLGQLATTLGDVASTVAAHHSAVFSELDQGRVEDARAELRAARAAADAASEAELAVFDENLAVMLLLSEGYVAALDDDEDGHRAAVESAIAVADADGRPFPRAVARTLAATSGAFLPDPARVARWAEDALELAVRFGFGWLEVSARCAAVAAEAQLGGDPGPAVAQITEIIGRHQETGRVGNLAAVLVMLAEVHRAAGDLEEARTCLRRALTMPGPYRALMTAHLERRLRALD